MGDVLESGAVPVAGTEFGPFEGRVWLNTAHQGPLPRPAVVAAGHAAALKAVPQRISDGDFTEIPERLRHLLATLVDGAPEQIVLGNSTSYGLHLVANGLSWRDGDEVLVIEGDYPATVLPWQRLACQGVAVRPLRPETGLLSASELAAAIGLVPGCWPSPGWTRSPGAPWICTRSAMCAGRRGCCWWSMPPRRWAPARST